MEDGSSEGLQLQVAIAQQADLVLKKRQHSEARAACAACASRLVWLAKQRVAVAACSGSEREVQLEELQAQQRALQEEHRELRLCEVSAAQAAESAEQHARDKPVHDLVMRWRERQGRVLEASIKAALRHLPAPTVPVEAPDSPGESQRAASKLQEAGARVEELNASLEAKNKELHVAQQAILSSPRAARSGLKKQAKMIEVGIEQMRGQLKAAHQAADEARAQADRAAEMALAAEVSPPDTVGQEAAPNDLVTLPPDLHRQAIMRSALAPATRRRAPLLGSVSTTPITELEEAIPVLPQEAAPPANPGNQGPAVPHGESGEDRRPCMERRLGELEAAKERVRREEMVARRRELGLLEAEVARRSSDLEELLQMSRDTEFLLSSQLAEKAKALRGLEKAAVEQGEALAALQCELAASQAREAEASHKTQTLEEADRAHRQELEGNWARLEKAQAGQVKVTLLAGLRRIQSTLRHGIEQQVQRVVVRWRWQQLQARCTELNTALETQGMALSAQQDCFDTLVATMQELTLTLTLIGFDTLVVTMQETHAGEKQTMMDAALQGHQGELEQLRQRHANEREQLQQEWAQKAASMALHKGAKWLRRALLRRLYGSAQASLQQWRHATARDQNAALGDKMRRQEASSRAEHEALLRELKAHARDRLHPPDTHPLGTFRRRTTPASRP